MNPSAFITRCMTLFHYFPYLSMEDGSSPTPFSEVQQRKFISKMLPEAGQQCMEDSGIFPSNTELTRMLEFINNQWKCETIRQDPIKCSGIFNEDT